LIK
jgi:hypothetical protein